MQPNTRAGEESPAPNGAASPETIQVCPECDRPSVAPLTTKPSGSHRGAETAYRCRKCGAHFDDPDERERRGDGGRSGLSGKLADPEFSADEILTDGGYQRRHRRTVRRYQNQSSERAIATVASRRQADALERIATAQEYQTDALAVVAGAIAELAHDEMPGHHSPESAVMEWQTWLDIHRQQFDRRMGR